MRLWIGAGVAAAAVSLVLCVSPATADIQATEVAAHEAWVDGIHLGERGGAQPPFVIEVDRKSPAKLAGLKAGDEIIRIQDSPVRGLRDAVRALNDLPAGRMVKIYADRGAVQSALEDSRTSEPAANSALPYAVPVLIAVLVVCALG